MRKRPRRVRDADVSSLEYGIGSASWLLLGHPNPRLDPWPEPLSEERVLDEEDQAYWAASALEQAIAACPPFREVVDRAGRVRAYANAVCEAVMASAFEAAVGSDLRELEIAVKKLRHLIVDVPVPPEPRVPSHARAYGLYRGIQKAVSELPKIADGPRSDVLLRIRAANPRLAGLLEKHPSSGRLLKILTKKLQPLQKRGIPQTIGAFVASHYLGVEPQTFLKSYIDVGAVLELPPKSKDPPP